MRFFSLLCFLFLASCISEENYNEERGSELEFTDLGQKYEPKSVWICYNPDSDHHGKICSDNLEPGTCLTPGKNSHFCWILNLEDCKNGDSLMYNEVCQNL